QQFKDSPNLYFTTITKASNPEVAAADFAAAHDLPQSEMISFLGANSGEFEKTARDFKLPTEFRAGESPVVALVDSSLTIVKHYDLSQREETIGLVQLISVIIPLPARKDIIVDRVKEL
ncbi:MAG: hypothetical protein AAF597_19810, partial [Bacteroidota bacterium]